MLPDLPPTAERLLQSQVSCAGNHGMLMQMRIYRRVLVQLLHARWMRRVQSCHINSKRDD